MSLILIALLILNIIYVSNPIKTFSERIAFRESLHNLNGELGLDLVLPNGLSIFMIYERNL